MRSWLRLRPAFLYSIEAALIGWFFISALRFFIGMVYSRAGASSILLSVPLEAIPPGTPGVLDLNAVTNEFTFIAYMLALPLLTIVLGRFRPLLMVGAALVAIGRVLMLGITPISPVIGSAMTVGGGLFYLAVLIRHRATTLPYLFIMGMALDQIARAAGNTLDPTWFADTVVSLPFGEQPVLLAYWGVQIGLSIAVGVLALVTVILQGRLSRQQDAQIAADRGLMSIWGGLGLGGLLFLQVSLLGLPNALTGRAGVDYTTFVPFVALALLMPIIPYVRRILRGFIGLFDPALRGWMWMALLVLLLILGLRVGGIASAIALLIAAFAASASWWWLARPQAEKERNISGLWVVVGILLFFVLVIADNFTYEYAYVRDLTADLAFLNPFVPPFLRGFRGMGLAILLLAAFLAALPIVQMRRRIPWPISTPRASLSALILVGGVSLIVAYASRPPIIVGVRDAGSLRVGTYNIHGGFSELYHLSLGDLGRTIAQSGAQVVMLQQVESGRLTSFGVDQPLWLGRQLGMDSRFYATNEGLQGLAVLSRVPIALADGYPLTSIGQQTGLQRVQIQADTGVIHLYNTWLGFLKADAEGRTIAQQEQDQQRQFAEILTLIGTHFPDGNVGRLMIGGTFNNTPDSPLYEQVRGLGFNDPFAGLPVELAATFNRLNYPPTRLDYLWLRNLPALEQGVINSSRASDHFMAVVGIELRRQ
jgi:endonuclease/exonuclease/phosphatase family metal-dependent hydrolase